jgi:hypothetical protein
MTGFASLELLMNQMTAFDVLMNSMTLFDVCALRLCASLTITRHD